MIAGSVGEVDTAIKAIDALAEWYEVDGLKLKVDTLIAVSKVPRLPVDNYGVIAERAIALVQDAKDKDDYTTATSLASIALTAARKGKHATLSRKATEVATEVQTLEKSFGEVKKAQDELAKTPLDPAANLIVGRFAIHAHSDWDMGLPMLALGSNDDLKALAAKDLEAPGEPSEQIALADDWWNYAIKEKGLDKRRGRERAAYWYEQALPTLTGLTKVKVEKRLSQISGAPVANDEGRRGQRSTPPTKVKPTPLRIPHKVGEVRRIEVDGPIHYLAFSGDGQLLSSTAGTWEVETGRALLNSSTSVGFRSFGIVGGGAVPNASAPAEIQSQLQAQMALGMGAQSARAFSSDGHRALLCGNDGAIAVRDLFQGKDVVRLKSHTGRVTAAALSPDERLAASGGQDGAIYIWDLQQAKEARHFGGDTHDVSGLAFSPNGRFVLSVCRDPDDNQHKNARLWDINTGREIRRYPTDHIHLRGDLRWTPKTGQPDKV